MIRLYLFGTWLGVFLSILIVPHLSFSYEILFHEEIIDYDKQETVMYSIQDDGSGLVKLGDGGFAQRSFDKTYISYIKTAPDYSMTGVYGDLVIKNVKSDEVLPVQNFSKVDCTVVECPRQPQKSDSLAMGHCTIKHCWNPDSNRVAYASVLGMSLRDGFVYLFDVKTRQTTRLHHFKYSRFTNVLWGMSLSWSPDGKLLLFNTTSMGPMDKNGADIYLIDPETQTVRKIETGYLPRFVNNKTIIFSTGSSIWSKHIDTGDKNKLVDIQGKVASISEVKQNRVLFQTAPEKIPDGGPINLFLLNVDTHQLEEIKVENHVFYCPNISPDGQKMTAFGMNWAERTMGYCVYDFKAKQAMLLKTLNVEENRGFWLGLLFGYGNHTHWN